MAKDGIEAELEQLRAQLEALQRAEAGREQEAGDGEAQGGGQVTESEEGNELLAHFRELLDSLDEELKESNPTTLLAVFTLGILVGRLLPR